MRKMFAVYVLVLAALLSGCGQNKTEEITIVGQPGAPGQDGISMGVDLSAASFASCPAGGTKVSTFVDSDRNGELSSEEEIKKVAYICNGTDGTNGVSVSVTSLSVGSAQCPMGGVLVSGNAICNGTNGQDGQNGVNGSNGLSAYQIALANGFTGSVTDWLISLKGPKGDNGTNGTNGLSAYEMAVANGYTGTATQWLASLVGPQGATGAAGGVGSVTPVQLCPGDTATYKEYGLLIGTNLYAVYYDANNKLGFLARLAPGNWVTTNGSNCQFAYANNGTTVTLTGPGGTTTINLNDSSSSSGNIAGSCLVKKFADYGQEKHYHFTLNGSNVAGDYKVVLNMSNNSGVISNNNTSNFTFSGGLYSLTPINGATTFDFYSSGSGSPSVNTATVVKVSDSSKTLNCTVDNSL